MTLLAINNHSFLHNNFTCMMMYMLRSSTANESHSKLTFIKLLNIYTLGVEVKYGRNWKGFDYCREFMVVIVRKEHGCASLHARALGRSRCGFIVALLYDTLIFYATFLSYFFLTIGSWRGTGCHGLGHLHSHVQVGLILSRTIKMDTCNWSNKSVHKRKERILLL